MGIRTSLPAGRRQVATEDLGLSEDETRKLVDALKGPVTYAGLDRLKDALDDSGHPDVRLAEVARRAQATLRGDSRSGGASSVSSGGVYDVRETPVLSTRRVTAVADEPEALQKLRADLRSGMWGQEASVEELVRLGKDHISPARRTPALIALCGDLAHGKDQALQLFALSLLGEVAKVLRVDLAGVTDRDVTALFGDDGPLGDSSLKKLAAAGGVVHLVNPDDLQSTAPKVAAEVLKRLLAKDGEPLHYDLCWAVDFNTEADPRALTIDALGKSGNLALAATASFVHLDGPTMWRYAKQLLPVLLESKPELSGLTLEFDPRAALALGNALATPFTPLDELEDRLLRLVLTHVDTQTSIDRDVAALRISVAPYLADEEIDGQVALLHQPTPDFIAAESLFVADAVGIRAGVEERRGVIAALTQTVQSLPAYRDGLFEGLTGSPVLEALADRFDEVSWDFSIAAQRVVADAALREGSGIYEILDTSEWHEIQTLAPPLEAVLADYVTEGLEALQGLIDTLDADPLRREQTEEQLALLSSALKEVVHALAGLAGDTIAEVEEEGT